jgi:ferredoxin-type protein NapH
MNVHIENLRRLFGAEPRRAERSEYTEAAKTIHANKKMTKVDFEKLMVEQREFEKKKKWTKRRWATLIAVNLMFVASYQLDVQLVEGSLSGSRLVGIHLIDINSALQLMLAHKHVIVNLLIGTATIGLFYALAGGRSFCSWVCPYHLLAEWAESLHLWLAQRKIVKDHPMHRGLRVVLWIVFGVLAYLTGYTVYESISPTGTVSRALIYGPGVAMLWVLGLLAFEVLYSRRAWCRYMCPIGLTYGVVGTFSPLRVTWKLANCHHEGECKKVCLVPHVLDHIVKGRAPRTQVDIGPDCTRCGKCIDVCPSGALSYRIVGLTKQGNTE